MFREGTTAQSQSAGAVRGQALSLFKQVLYNLLKTHGFYKALFL